ncbi:MAG TPA: TIGR01906 family membrane protein [Clostridiaceae bacterium]|nr:TIGR01906 family membrane protein [Clostridiaceae bacterium]
MISWILRDCEDPPCLGSSQKFQYSLRKKVKRPHAQGMGLETMKQKLSIASYALLHALAILTGSVILGLHTRVLYYRFIPKIQSFNEAYSGAMIRKNYDLLIDYLNPFYRGDLVLHELPMSPQGAFHFYEVKVIFDLVYGLFLVTFLLSLFFYFRNKKRKTLGYLKGAAALTFILPVLLSIPFLLDFSRAFVVFHELAFSNDYWIFDPRIDPVIKILPEWFFMYAAFLILVYMILFALGTYYLGKKQTKKFTS